MKTRGKQKPAEFSDELNREKLKTKNTKDAAPPQPRGSKVATDIGSEGNSPLKEPVAEGNTRKRSSDAANKKSAAAPKRSSSTGVKGQVSSSATAPPKRSSSAGKKFQVETTLSPEQDGKQDADKNPEEDANGLYGIFVQTRRCEELCSSLGLTMSDIRKMKHKYDDNDMYHSGEITQAEFFFMINEEQRPLTNGILRLADVPKDQKFLSFDQYLLCVITFAVYTKPELYQFVFDLYDDDKSGALDEREFMKMSLELQSKQFNFPANVTMAIKLLEGKDRAAFAPDDGLVDLGEFMKFAKNFPVAFYPIMNMQKNVRAATLGESRWSRITANKLKVQQLVSYMRQHQGAIPQLTLRESVANVFSSDIFKIRKRAGELYALELAQRHRVSTGEIDGD